MKHKKMIIFLILLEFIVKYNSLFCQEFTPEQIYEKVNRVIVMIISYDNNGSSYKQGSGVIINDKRWIVTNYHVCKNSSKIIIKQKDNIIKYDKIIYYDELKDILIFSLDDSFYPQIQIGNSDNLKIGQKIYAIGNPLGLENTISEGIISGLRPLEKNQREFIQITASISHGSSGGAVVNSFGELIGISSMSFTGGQNLNFAIPINDIMEITPISNSNIMNSHIEARDPKNPFFINGNKEMNNKNYESAIINFIEYLKINPEDAYVCINLGVAYINQKNYAAALECFDKAIELDSNYARALSSRGACLILFKEYTQAGKDLRKALLLDPEDMMTYNSLATLHAYQGDTASAFVLWDEAIKRNPDYIETYWNRGALFFNFNDYERAFKDVNKAIEINPNIPKSFYFRGTLYKYTKEYDKAMADYNTALKLDPNDAEAYVRRGILYLVMEEYTKAVNDMEHSYKLNPDLKDQTKEYYEQAKQKAK